MTRTQLGEHSKRILILGGGLMGLAIAHQLARRDQNVTVLSRRRSEAAGFVAAGMLAPHAEGLEAALLRLGQLSLSRVASWVAQIEADSGLPIWEAKKSSETTVPFMKDNSFDYERLVAWMGDWAVGWGWLAFIPLVILIVTAVSNGANLTDGIDGLATGSSAIIGLGLAGLAYVSSNIVTADYLNIHYIPRSEELVVFIAAFVGGCIAFLWYNAFPAQVFMGDTGSLALGGIIAAFAIAIRKELLLPVLCGIFLIENLSVVLQVGWFKYTKRKTGEGRRIFLMAPLHHHYQKQNIPESKITARFWIVGILLAVVTIVTLKVR